MPRNRMARRIAAITAATTALVMTVSGCSSTGSGTADSKGAKLAIGATVEPVGLDMTTTSGAAIPQALLYNVYETLVKVNADGRLTGLLADQWQLSPDRLTYTFTLQPHATFASGKAVDAASVVASIEHEMADKDAAGHPIEPSVHAQMSDVASADAKDAHTVEVHLKKPSNLWLYYMAGPAGIVIDPSASSAMATQTAGSGPYRFESWKKGDSITLVRNDRYWGNAPHFQQVQFKYYGEPTALTNALSSGEINIISDLTQPDALGQFQNDKKYQVIEGSTTGQVVLGFNHASAPLKNLAVRQAIDHAIDRKALLDTVWGGHGTMIGSMVAPSDPYWQDLSGDYAYDPAKARQLLAQAGHAKGLTLNLRVPNVAYATASAQFIAAQLKQVGISVNVTQLDFPTWLKQVFTQGNYDMTIVNHVEDYSIVKWANPSYYWHYDNRAFQKQVSAADQASTDQFVPMMQKAARMLSSDAAADFLFGFPRLTVADSDLNGLAQNQTSASFDVTNLASSKG